MKKLLFRAFVPALICAIGLSSCNTGSSDVVTEQTLGYCLTYSKNVDSHAQVFNRMSFAAQYNYTNNTVDLALIGTIFPVAGNATGQAYPKMEFSTLPWKYNQFGWKETEVENVTPTINGVSNPPKFKKLKFGVLDGFNGSSYAPGIMYKFEIDHNGSDVEVMGCCMTGKTESTDPDGVTYCPEDDAQVSDKNKPVYWVDFNFETSKADIYIFNAKFLDRMPSLNLEFTDVPFGVVNGEVTLTSDALTPEYDGIPYPSFPITNLKATVDFTKGMNLEFHCDFRGSDYTVKFEGKY